MKFFGSIACALLAGIFMSGCFTEQPEPVEKKLTDARIELVNNEEFSLDLLSVNTKIDDSGLLTVDVAVALSNTPAWPWIWGGDPKVNLNYRFLWIDDKGVSHEAARHVIPSLPGNIIGIHGIAPSESAVSFKLKISVNEEEAKPAPEAKPEVKAEAAKPVAAKPEVKAEAAKPVAAKPELKPAAAPVAAKPAAVPAVKTEAKADPSKPASKPVKLTESFE